MANTDISEWRLLGTSLIAASTDRILPTGSSHLYLALNEPGSGELKIPLDSLSAAATSSGKFALASYRGGVRGGMFVENIGTFDADASEGGGRWMSISGRGAMAMLDKVKIAGDGTTATTRDFTAVTKGSILKTLIDEAVARGALSAFSYTFTATVDSSSVAWTDSETYKLNVGMSYLEVVHQFAKTGIDFECVYSTGAGFVLKAYKNGIGTDKSETIYFRVGTNCEEVHSDERGNELENALTVAWKDGQVLLEDATSIAAYGRQEGFLDAKIAQTASSATTYGAAVLASRKDPKKGISVKIYDGVGPRVFVDYILGDTITLDVLGVETTYRVLGIQLDWDGKDYSSVIVELNNLMLENEIDLSQNVDWLLNQWNTAHDADLLEVSFWAAIGNDDFAFLPGEMSSIGRYLCMHKIGDTIYFANTNNGRLTSYSIASGQWDLASELTITYPHCMTSIGTDLYIGGGGAWKFDTLTGTLTSLGTVYPTASPIGRIFSATVIGTDVYFGGKFDSAETTTYGNFVRYNTVGSTWHDCGSGAAGTVNTLLADGSNVVLGGANLSAINGVAVNKVGKWNGTTGVAMNTGLDNAVYALAVYGSNILAGGTFTGGISEWNGSSWTTLGGGVVGSVYGIAVYLTDIYIIGTFTDVGNYISRYSGGVWWQLLTGLNDYASDIVLNNNDVYVTGIFTSADGKAAQYVAAYFTNFDNLLDYLENSSSSFNMGAAIHAAAASTISDSDEVPFWEDITNALRKITWANIKATLKTYFDTLYFAITQTANRIPFVNGSGNTIVGDALEYADADKLISLGKSSGNDANMIFSFDSITVTFFNLATWGVGLYSSIRGIFSRGTKASPTAVLANDVLMRFRGSGYDGTTPVLSSATNAEMKVIANQNLSNTAHGGRLEFWTTPNGSTTETLAVTIEADGSLTYNDGFATTVTAGGTTTLTAASKKIQHFSGDRSQTLVLPVASTLALGRSFIVINDSDGTFDGLGIIYVKSSGSNDIIGLIPGAYTVITCISLTGTTAASWDLMRIPEAGLVFSANDSSMEADTITHGLLRKLTAPAAGLLNVLGIANTETTQGMKALFDTTNPAAIGTAAPGTQIIAARRDHVHASTDISAKVYKSANQAITTATETILTFDSEEFDTDTIHDNVTNNSRLTCKTAGKYIVILQVRFADNATGYRFATITKNGSYAAAQMQQPISGNGTNIVVTSLVSLAVNDYVEGTCYQSSGGNLNVIGGSAGHLCYFMMVKQNG